MGKTKAKFSTSSILKKINSTKIILKKKTCGKILYQNKNHVRENIVVIYNVFLYKKTTKLNSQPAQYEKKNKKTKKQKMTILKNKNHTGKHCSNPQCLFLNDIAKFSTSLILEKKSAKIILKKIYNFFFWKKRSQS